MNLEHKVCLVTGANSGIGKATTMELARRGAYVLMLCRNEERAETARRDIMEKTGHSGLEIIIADLAHQHDIRRAAEQVRKQYDALDILINNAGIIPAGRQETPEGIERTLAINHLGPFLLTNLLLEPLRRASSARIITVSSEVHRLGARAFDLDNLQLQQGYSPMKAYGVSKLCNIMFTHELARRTEGEPLTANALHPGVVRTQLADEASWMMKLFYFIGRPFMKSPQGGAETSLYLAASDEVEGVSGKYFRNSKVATPADPAFDDTLTEVLWERSAALTSLDH